jgi:o-succinylbenzoate---CoA ligase
MLTAASLDAHVAASAAVLPPLGPGDRWLVCLPMTSIGALAALWRALSAGACLGLVERFDADQARRFMAAGASHVSIVPAMLAPLAGRSRAGAARPALPVERRRPVDRSHGRHRAGARLAPVDRLGHDRDPSHVAAGPVDCDWREGVVGRPLPGARIDIDAATGRLAVGGAMVMSGYARRAWPGRLGLEADGRLLSGDLGEFLPTDGCG